MTELLGIARLVIGLLLLLVAVALTGCATDESENASTRPWNTPKMWENGLPSNITEGR